MLPRLVSTYWAQAILLHQPSQQVGLKACTTAPGPIWFLRGILAKDTTQQAWHVCFMPMACRFHVTLDQSQETYSLAFSLSSNLVCLWAFEIFWLSSSFIRSLSSTFSSTKTLLSRCHLNSTLSCNLFFCLKSEIRDYNQATKTK